MLSPAGVKQLCDDTIPVCGGPGRPDSEPQVGVPGGQGTGTDRAAASGDGDAFARDGPWDLRWVRGDLLDDDASYHLARADCPCRPAVA
jgi:hypothetical protein